MSLKSNKVVVVIVAILFSAAIPTFITFRLTRQSSGPIAPDREASRRVAKGGTEEDRRFIAGNAIVEPAEPETKVATDAPGRIADIRVKEGDRVKKGDLLLELEDSVPKAELAAAEADVSAAEAELARTVHGLRSQDVSAVLSESIAARSRAELARTELSRAEELSSKAVISKAEIDSARRKYEAERAESNAANARASGAKAGSRQEDIMIAEAHLRGANARREMARASLTRYVILAPVDGEVLRIKARVGEYYTPARGDALAIIGDTSRLRIRMDIDERDVSRVKIGQPAYVTAGAFGDTHFPGKLVEVGRRMGRRTVRIDDPIDRVDVKILEVVIELEGNPPLLPGLRVLGRVGPLDAP